MARQPQRDTRGRWSLRQIASEARLTLRTITRLADLGWIDATNLGYRDIAVSRVAAALLDAPRAPGTSREQAPTVHAERVSQALALTRDLAARADKIDDQWLIITAEVSTLGNALAVANAVSQQTQPVLLLPVGAWVTEAHRIAHGQEVATSGDA